MTARRVVIKGMTGFGAGAAERDGVRFEVEIKGVNNRFLEQRVKLPAEFGGLEAELKRRVQERIARGRVDTIVVLTAERAEGVRLEVRQALVEGYRRRASCAAVITCAAPWAWRECWVCRRRAGGVEKAVDSDAARGTLTGHSTSRSTPSTAHRRGPATDRGSTAPARRGGRRIRPYQAGGGRRAGSAGHRLRERVRLASDARSSIQPAWRRR
jgi:hypothetical protein